MLANDPAVSSPFIQNGFLKRDSTRAPYRFRPRCRVSELRFGTVGRVGARSRLVSVHLLYLVTIRVVG
jgi:hypothetical protein